LTRLALKTEFANVSRVKYRNAFLSKFSRKQVTSKRPVDERIGFRLCNILKLDPGLPTRRNLAKPVNAAVLHGRVWVEAPGDRVGEDCEALLLQQIEQAPLLVDQRIDPHSLAVEEFGDNALFRDRWETRTEILDESVRYTLLAARAVHLPF